MADYIYLLEHRLSPAQQRALSLVRTAVRARDLTLFLTGGAVRDLTGGASVRDLDVTVQGETASLRGDLEAAGGVFVGEFPPSQSLYFVFPGGVRVEVAAAMSVTYPKPGEPVYELTSIGEDLRRRDFTANAMALSLNEGSYGLLMDPLNGVADIEHRELRLVSNYGFLEDPSRMLRAVRLSSRLGWQMEARTQQRYDNAKEDVSLDMLSAFVRGYEVEEVFYEEDPQRVMRALQAESWLDKLSPSLSPTKANEAGLSDLRDKQGQLQTQGILADAAAVSFPLLVAKLPAAEVSALKASFARPGFVREIDTLEERTRELQSRLNGKDAAQPSVAWRMLYDAEPGVVLAMFHAGKAGAVQARLKTFLTESPNARQRLPYQLMQEMRIHPDNPVYREVLDKVFFELMDGKLQTPEEMKAYLEPYSPPAPPPPLNLRRARAKKEARPSRAKAKKAVSVVEEEEALGVADGLMEPGTLTGPDRGDTPTEHEPLAGNVAPLAPGEAEPPAGKPAPKKAAVKLAPPSAAVLAEAASPAAKRLTAKPAPLPPDEAEALLPHPLATREIADVPASPASREAKAANASGAKASSAPVPDTAAKAAVKSSVAKPTVVPPARSKAAPEAEATAKAEAHAKTVAPAPPKLPDAAGEPAKTAKTGGKPPVKDSAVTATMTNRPVAHSTAQQVPAKSPAEATADGRGTPKKAATKPAAAPAPVPSKAAPSRTAPAKTAPPKPAPSKGVASKTAPSKTVPAKTSPAKAAPERSAAPKAAPSKSVAPKSVASKSVSSKAAQQKSPPAASGKADKGKPAVTRAKGK